MAEWHPTPGQHVQLQGLKAKHHNDTYDIVVGAEASPEAADCWAAAKRIPVRRGDLKQLLCIKAENLRPPTFVVQPVPRKGMGVVAARKIAKGERILLKPLLFSMAAGGYSFAHMDEELAGLSQEQREAFYELAESPYYTEAGRPEPVAKFETNALPMPLDSSSGDFARGIFLIASRFNHSCLPNVMPRWNSNLKGLAVHAATDIGTGEELCILYIDEEMTYLPRARRRAQLSRVWRFECTCAACSLKGDQLATSDARREALHLMLDAMPYIYGTLSNSGLEEVLRVVEEALALLREEGLDYPALRHTTGAYNAFQGCMFLGKHEEARVWLQRAYDDAVLAEGEDGKRAQGRAERLKRPLTIALHP